MSCNPTRIELSDAATTTMEVTVSPDPGAIAVTFSAPGLGINDAETTSSGTATFTILAQTARENTIWDATLQVGSNAAVSAEIQIVESNVGQSIGVTISSAGVTYCAPTNPGGGGGIVEVQGTAPINVAAGTTLPVVSLDANGVTTGKIADDAVTAAKLNDVLTTTPGPFTNASITVDAQGRLTSASSGSAGSTGTVTSVTAGAGLTGGTITTAGTIAHASGSFVGSEEYPVKIVLDAFGHVQVNESETTAAAYRTATGTDDAANLTTGKVPDARLNIGTTAGDLIVLDGSAKLPAIDGSQLTNLPSGGVTSIVAGTNVTISPVGGTGAVTVNSSGGGAASTNWIQDPDNTGTWRIFDDLLGNSPRTASPWGSGVQNQNWAYFSNSDDNDIIGGYRTMLTSTAYARGGVAVPSLGKVTPSNGDNWLVEMRVKIAWGDEADTVPQFSFGAFQGGIGSQDNIGPGYGNEPRAGIYVTMQGTEWQSFISDSTANATPTKAAISPSVAFANDGTYNLACHGTYLTASGGWELDWYIDGTLVHTSTLTAGTGCPFVRTNMENGTQPPSSYNERYTQFDWINLQYTRPSSITYLDIDNL